MSHESSKNVQLIVVSVCVTILSFLVSLFLKVSSFEMMAVSAGYAIAVDRVSTTAYENFVDYPTE
jgi:hypothetical protein